VLSGGKNPRRRGCGEGKETREDGGDDPPGLQREEPDAAKEAVEIAIDALGQDELRQQRVHRLAESLRDPVERANAGRVGATLVLAQEVGAKEGPSGDVPLRQVEEIADLTDAASQGAVEAFRAVQSDLRLGMSSSFSLLLG
jgi:hypothetical protein